jgi:hypothetical protein
MTQPVDFEAYRALFRETSEAAFEAYCREDLASGPVDRAYSAILREAVLQAQVASRAVYSLLAGNSHLPALALARVRLEQTIVCSYLVHEQPAAALKPYASFVPISEFRSATRLLADQTMAPHVQGQLDIAALRDKALAAQLDIDPGFDITRGKVQAKWTKLDLASMATRRDDLARSSGWLLSAIPLAPVYTALYRTASCVVHPDASALGLPFVGVLSGGDGATLPAPIFWAASTTAYLATLDVLQCYEVLRWHRRECDTQFLAIAHALG